MSDLIYKKCLPCEGGVPPLGEVQINELIKQTPEWTYNPMEHRIERKFTFSNFHETMAFVNAVAWVAHTENHHPDMQVSYGHCLMYYNTHAVGGLTENDFICAAKVDALLAQ